MGLLRRIAVVFKSFIVDTADKIDRVAEEELMTAPATDPTGSVSPQPMRVHPSQLNADYQLLGLQPGADLAAVEAAWRRLAGRADPKRFPAGSDEEKRAAEILKSLNEAYSRLREAMNPTEGRFGQLEL
jgi:DnaJ-domain-containing protein 1